MQKSAPLGGLFILNVHIICTKAFHLHKIIDATFFERSDPILGKSKHHLSLNVNNLYQVKSLFRCLDYLQL